MAARSQQKETRAGGEAFELQKTAGGGQCLPALGGDGGEFFAPVPRRSGKGRDRWGGGSAADLPAPPGGGRTGAAIGLQAVLFAALHGSLRAKCYALGMGLIFGWAAEQTGGLGTGLVLHLLNNGIIAAATLAERGMG